MNNWKVIFAALIIFGAGVMTGGLLVNYVQHPYKKAAHPKPPANTEAHPPASPAEPPRLLSKQFMQQLDASLQLQAEQREAIQKIIAEGQNQVRKAIQDARLEIREILTAAQREEFDNLVKRPFHKPLFETNAPPNLPPKTNSLPDTNVKTI